MLDQSDGTGFHSTNGARHIATERAKEEEMRRKKTRSGEVGPAPSHAVLAWTRPFGPGRPAQATYSSGDGQNLPVEDYHLLCT